MIISFTVTVDDEMRIESIGYVLEDNRGVISDYNPQYTFAYDDDANDDDDEERWLSFWDTMVYDLKEIRAETGRLYTDDIDLLKDALHEGSFYGTMESLTGVFNLIDLMH